MANESVTDAAPGKMVEAYGDHGLEFVSEEEVVKICCVPLGSCNEIIPATIRHLSTTREGGGHIPERIRRIRWPTVANGRRYASVEFDCTPFVRYTMDRGPVFGYWAGCCVRNMRDAQDPIFSSLTIKERRRIERAARAADQCAAHASAEVRS